MASKEMPSGSTVTPPPPTWAEVAKIKSDKVPDKVHDKTLFLVGKAQPATEVPVKDGEPTPQE